MWPVIWGNNVTQSVYSERWQEGIGKILTKDRKDLERTHAIVTRNLKTLNTPGKYYNFSDFLIEHWLTDKDDRNIKKNPKKKETYREIAYKHCHDKVQKSGAVSRPTLRHWFGFGKADTNKITKKITDYCICVCDRSVTAGNGRISGRRHVRTGTPGQ